ncbi:MAG: ABC transporter permease, partial [Planctomycetota bacterium]
MTLTSLAISNLRRHLARTILTMSGVLISTATLFSILSFDAGYEKALKEELASTGTHLFVSTEGCPSVAATMLIRGGEIPRYMKMNHLKTAKKLPEVKAAGGFLIFTGIKPDGGVDLFFGITKGVLDLKSHWEIKGNWFTKPNEVILGRQIADKHKAKVGQKIKIESIGEEFTVTGILNKTRGQDDHFYFLPIKTAQKIFRKEDKLTAIGIQLKDISKMSQVKNELEKMPEAYVVPAE